MPERMLLQDVAVGHAGQVIGNNARQLLSTAIRNAAVALRSRQELRVGDPCLK